MTSDLNYEAESVLIQRCTVSPQAIFKLENPSTEVLQAAIESDPAIFESALGAFHGRITTSHLLTALRHFASTDSVGDLFPDIDQVDTSTSFPPIPHDIVACNEFIDGLSAVWGSMDLRRLPYFVVPRSHIHTHSGQRSVPITPDPLGQELFAKRVATEAPELFSKLVAKAPYLALPYYFQVKPVDTSGAPMSIALKTMEAAAVESEVNSWPQPIQAILPLQHPACDMFCDLSYSLPTDSAQRILTLSRRAQEATQALPPALIAPDPAPFASDYTGLESLAAHFPASSDDLEFWLSRVAQHVAQSWPERFIRLANKLPKQAQARVCDALCANSYTKATHQTFTYIISKSVGEGARLPLPGWTDRHTDHVIERHPFLISQAGPDIGLAAAIKRCQEDSVVLAHLSRSLLQKVPPEILAKAASPLLPRVGSKLSKRQLTPELFDRFIEDVAAGELRDRRALAEYIQAGRASPQQIIKLCQELDTNGYDADNQEVWEAALRKLDEEQRIQLLEIFPQELAFDASEIGQFSAAEMRLVCRRGLVNLAQVPITTSAMLAGAADAFESDDHDSPFGMGLDYSLRNADDLVSVFRMAVQPNQPPAIPARELILSASFYENTPPEAVAEAVRLHGMNCAVPDDFFYSEAYFSALCEGVAARPDDFGSQGRLLKNTWIAAEQSTDAVMAPAISDNLVPAIFPYLEQVASEDPIGVSCPPELIQRLLVKHKATELSRRSERMMGEGARMTHARGL